MTALIPIATFALVERITPGGVCEGEGSREVEVCEEFLGEEVLEDRAELVEVPMVVEDEIGPRFILQRTCVDCS